MHKSALLALAPLAALVRAGVDFDYDDVPQVCRSTCRPLEDLSNRCDTDLPGDNNDREEDRLEAQCFCTNDSFDVAGTAALCYDCVKQNRGSSNGNNDNDNDDDGDDDDNDNDDNNDDDHRDAIRDIENMMRTCSFTATSSWDSAATTATSVSVSAERPTNTDQLTTTFVNTQTDSSGNPTETGSNDNNDNNNDNNDDDNDDDDNGAAASSVSIYLAGLMAAGGAFMLV